MQPSSHRPTNENNGYRNFRTDGGLVSLSYPDVYIEEEDRRKLDDFMYGLYTELCKTGLEMGGFPVENFRFVATPSQLSLDFEDKTDWLIEAFFGNWHASIIYTPAHKADAAVSNIFRAMKRAYVQNIVRAKAELSIALVEHMYSLSSACYKELGGCSPENVTKVSILMQDTMQSQDDYALILSSYKNNMEVMLSTPFPLYKILCENYRNTDEYSTLSFDYVRNKPHVIDHKTHTISINAGDLVNKG